MLLNKKTIAIPYYKQSAYFVKFIELVKPLKAERAKGKMPFILHNPKVTDPHALYFDLPENLKNSLLTFPAIPEIFLEGDFSKKKLHRIMVQLFKALEVPELNAKRNLKFSITLNKEQGEAMIIYSGYNYDYEKNPLSVWHFYNLPLA